MTAAHLSAAQAELAGRAFSLPFSAAHLVGVAGSGMKSLAEILHDLNCRLSGSDRMLSPQRRAELQPFCETLSDAHWPGCLPPHAEALLYSPAVPPENAERQEAVRRGIPQFSLPEILGRLMRDCVGISVAGTHGKTTTTALIAWILYRSGRSPSAFVGGTVKELQRGGWMHKGPEFVVESCEFRRHFLHLQPQQLVLLNIEPDHFETYPEESALLDGFAEFLGRVPQEGTVLLNGECRRSVAAARKAGRRCETFGSTPHSDWWFDDVQQRERQTSFRLHYRDSIVGEFESPLWGRHNIFNAVAAVALCLTGGLSAEAVRTALRAFPGVRRRLDEVGEWQGATLFEDYAHHPTAVAATLQSVREMFPRHRLWCVFQPHQIRRVRHFSSEFAAALALADEILLTPVFTARETPMAEGENCNRQLAERLREKGKSCRFCPSLDQVLPTLDDALCPRDVVVLMGAGDIERIRHELARRISRDHTTQ